MANENTSVRLAIAFMVERRVFRNPHSYIPDTTHRQSGGMMEKRILLEYLKNFPKSPASGESKSYCK